MKQILLFLCALSIVSCQKPTIEVRTSQQETPFYFRFEVKDTISEDYQYVDYTLGDSVWISGFFDTAYYRLALRHRMETINGTYYFRTGLTEIRSGICREDIFGFGFAIPGLEPGKIPSKTIIEDFFRTGRSIPFGLGPEKVNAILRLQIGNPASYIPSQTVFLYEPYGELLIQEVEDYEMQYHTSPEEVRRGKRITCTFEGGIGVYAPQPSVDAVSYTDVAIDLRNGEAVFFMPYE